MAKKNPTEKFVRRLSDMQELLKQKKRKKGKGNYEVKKKQEKIVTKPTKGLNIHHE